MQKKRLLMTYPLEADAQMIQKAMKDFPTQEKGYYKTIEKYQYDIHMNCQIKEGILMTGLYFTRDLRLGAVTPAFEIFIDRENERYITWDFVQGKWKSGLVEHLGWKSYFGMYHFSISEEDNQQIKDYLQTENDGSAAIGAFQRSILKKRLEERYQKETSVWDEVLSEIQDLPKDWDLWADRHGMQQHYLFYDYSRRKKQKGYCTWCRKIVPIAGKPKHNQTVRAGVAARKCNLKQMERQEGFVQKQKLPI